MSNIVGKLDQRLGILEVDNQAMNTNNAAVVPGHAGQTALGQECQGQVSAQHPGFQTFVRSEYFDDYGESDIGSDSVHNRSTCHFQ